MVKLLVCGDVRGKLDVLATKVQRLNSSAHGPFDALLCVGEFAAAANSAPELQPFIDGTRSFPVPAYFVVGRNALPAAVTTVAEGDASGGAKAAEEVCAGAVQVAPNVTFLGWSGVANVSGLKVAFLSGKYDPLAFRDAREPAHSGAYHQEDVRVATCLRGAKSVPARRAGDSMRLCVWRAQVDVLTKVAGEDGFKGVDMLLTCEWPFRCVHARGARAKRLVWKCRVARRACVLLCMTCLTRC